VEPSKGVSVEDTSAPSHGLPDTALNSVRDTNSQGLV
jgi:hypothetical protein